VISKGGDSRKKLQTKKGEETKTKKLVRDRSACWGGEEERRVGE